MRLSCRKKIVGLWVLLVTIFYIIAITFLNGKMQAASLIGSREAKSGLKEGESTQAYEGWLDTKLGYPFSRECRHAVHQQSNTSGMFTEVVEQKLFVFSAFVDTRTQPFYVRMISVVLFQTNEDIYCHFLNRNNTATFTSVKVRYAEMCENHHLPYGGSILHCLIPDGSVAEHVCEVILSQKPTHNHGQPGTTVYLMTIKAEPDTPKLDFALCVPPLYGQPDPYHLVQFFELTQLLGVSKIFIYLFTTDKQVARVVRHYEAKGVVIVLPWKLPFEGETDMYVKDRFNKVLKIKRLAIWYNGQSIASNDCLYRTMASFNFTIFNDIDEFLVPKAGLLTWHSMMATLFNDSIIGYSFRSAFYEPNYLDLLPLSYNRSVSFSDKRNKVLVQPDKVNEVGIHHVSSWLPGYNTKSVTTDFAYIHHVTKCKREIIQKCNGTLIDHSLEVQYGKTLRQNVNSTMKMLLRP